MTRKVTAPCFRMRLLLPYTVKSIACKITHVPIPHSCYRRQNPAAIQSFFLLTYFSTSTLPLGETSRFNPACMPVQALLAEQQTPYISIQRTVLCCAQYIFVIEKGKNVLLRALFRSRALNRIVYLCLYVKHNGVDNLTGCSIACPWGRCQEFFKVFSRTFQFSSITR